MTVFEQRIHEQIQQVSQHICDLTLRDLFAIAVINGLSVNAYLNSRTLSDFAELAYEQADAMLKAREAK